MVWDYDTTGQPVATVLGKAAKGGEIDGAGPTVAGGMVYVTSGYQDRVRDGGDAADGLLGGRPPTGRP